jgi:hypothetical protein
MNNSTIQHNHNFELGRTYAVDVNFNKEDLLECVHSFDHPIGVRVGIAYLNPKDKCYNKKIGREVSSKALDLGEFKFRRIENDGDKSFIYLTSNSLQLQVVFRVFKYSEKPHLIEVYDFGDIEKSCGNCYCS